MKLCLFVLSLITVLSFPAIAAENAKETAYERVIRTGTLRCGYITWPPFFEKDLKTGEVKGFDADYVEAIAKSLDLKVDWVGEVPVGQSVEELRSGKIDAICASEGPLFPSTTKHLSYSKPFAYFPFFLYAKNGDTRFDNNLQAINSSEVRIAVVDGDISSEIVATFFPNATKHSMVQMISPTQMYMDVASGKADLFIDGPVSVIPFQKENPNSVRRVIMNEPLSVIPNTFSVLRGPQGNDLVAMLNQAIDNLRNSGKEPLIFAPYIQDIPGMIYPVAKPYEKP